MTAADDVHASPAEPARPRLDPALEAALTGLEQTSDGLSIARLRDGTAVLLPASIASATGQAHRIGYRLVDALDELDASIRLVDQLAASATRFGISEPAVAFLLARGFRVTL